MYVKSKGLVFLCETNPEMLIFFRLVTALWGPVGWTGKSD